MALKYSVDLWATDPKELLRIPVAVVKPFSEVELTLSYSTYASATVQGYVGGKSKIRTGYASQGNYVISQQFNSGANIDGGISAYHWNATAGDPTNINTKYRVNLTVDIQQKILFSASLSWHKKDITIDLAPPMDIMLKPSVHVLSKVKGFSQCVDSNVKVSGHFHVSKAELEVEAFGVTIW
ncbi:uncharacterized protein LOC121368686 [Gigantopelta aegis]|uniref:uncharacterized protein LOC121368686 n=1 Tax=Gigantopelta aegis TaxID=1735272 RepID=UPI001B88C17E|nr:uncharacterized protein LOC121368686 [Gigantopelta aegis]